MENVLTIAGCGQLMLSLWVMDWVTSVPGLILGVVVFGVLVSAVREVLTEDKPAPRPASRHSKAFKAARVVYK